MQAVRAYAGRNRQGYLPTAIDSSRIALPQDGAGREYCGATGHELSAPMSRGSMKPRITRINTNMITRIGRRRYRSQGILRSGGVYLAFVV
ncbi:MAG: hypothetical protein LBF60_06685 [Treponema sp.]|nr:hypothetical protein [Treponema sp.]